MTNSNNAKVTIAQSQTAFIMGLQQKHRCSFTAAVYKAIELAQLAQYANTATAANEPIQSSPAPLLA